MPPAKPPAARQTGQKSPVRQAIELLLYQPTLASEITLPVLISQCSQSGVPLLLEIIELLQLQPGLNTASLLEHWRDREDGRSLTRLACWAPALDDLELAADLQGYLNEIQRQHIENRIKFLDSEQKQRPLSSAEKQEYGKLLLQSHDARQH